MSEKLIHGAFSAYERDESARFVRCERAKLSEGKTLLLGTSPAGTWSILEDPRHDARRHDFQSEALDLGVVPKLRFWTWIK